MAFEMRLPEMGESVQEATVVKWLKSVGDIVEEDETILEVATDKVDSEVPSPVKGKILELKVSENDVAEIGSIIALIESDAESEELELVSSKTEEKPSPSKTEKTSRLAIYLPEMGESVQEATINTWLKEVGDDIKEDDNLVEISTDKVDSEVPSPYAGKLLEIAVPEGQIAKIGEAIAYIESETSEGSTQVKNSSTASAKKIPDERKAESKASPKIALNGQNNAFYSPLVKKIAKTEAISSEELSRIQGTGRNQRLTKNDILNYLKHRSSITIQDSSTTSSGNFPHQIAPVQVSYDPDRVTIEPMSTMRKGIAKHMVQSLYTAPHVFSIHDVNMKKVWDWRNAIKARFKKKYGFNLTLTHILMDEVAKAIRKNPRINSSIDGDNIIVRHDINLGMAVGYTAKNGDNGLMVPVLPNIDELTLVGIARKASELIHKTRNHQLKPDDMAGGTFTVTNVGTFGTELGLGIINQPQVAILSFGAIVKRPVVTADDAIQIAPMMKMALCYDHRVVDGMLGGQFLFDLQSALENYQGDDAIV